LAVVLILCLINVVSRYPGIPNFDSDAQYAQAVSRQFTDWHPPIMAWLWSGLRYFVYGSGLLFALHVSLYWFGFGLIALTLMRIGSPIAAWAVVGVGLLPPILMMNIQIHKDVGLAVTLLSSFAIVFWYRARGQPVNLAAGACAFILLTYGCLVRANAVFAVPPLLIYMFYPSLIHRLGWFIGSYIALAVFAVAATGVFNTHVIGAQPNTPIRSLQIFDLAGIAFYSGDVSIFGSDKQIDSKLLSRCYTPVFWDPLAGREIRDCLALRPVRNSETASKWLLAIPKHPIAYIRHRVNHFNAELGSVLPRHHPDDAKYNWLRFVDKGPTTVKEWAIDLVRYSAPFRPWFCFVAGFVILWIYFSGNQSRALALDAAVFCLTVSGLAYMGAYLVVGVSSEFRYQYWAMIAIFVAGVLCVTARQEELSSPTSIGKIALGALLLALVVIQVGGFLGWFPSQYGHLLVKG
jgi:hypothetical protein